MTYMNATLPNAWSDIPETYKSIYRETIHICGMPINGDDENIGIAQTAASMFHTMRVLQYIIENDIPGAFVECGVWRGASPIIMIKMLQNYSAVPRNIWVYDTFTGQDNGDMCSPFDDVKARLDSLDYKYITYVRGKVESTLPLIQNKPCAISFLRLDTDDYDSTAAEFKWLEPLVSVGGVIVVDDYGGQDGCKQAVDEHTQGKLFLHRIDEHVRSWVK